MRLSEVFTFVVDRAGRMLRFTLPADHTMEDVERAQRLTAELPRIFDVPASEAKTDHVDTTDMPTMKLPAVKPKAKPSAWFEEEEGKGG